MKTVKNYILFVIAGLSIASTPVHAFSLLGLCGTLAGVGVANRVYRDNQHPENKQVLTLKKAALKNNLLYLAHLFTGGLIGLYGGIAANRLFTLLNTKSMGNGALGYEKEQGIIKVDWYEFLGVKPNATTEEINRAYKLKARKCHTDKNKTAENEELIRFLTVINKLLSDAQHRATYDKLRSEWFLDPFHETNFSEKSNFENPKPTQ